MCVLSVFILLAPAESVNEDINALDEAEKEFEAIAAKLDAVEGVGLIPPESCVCIFVCS